MAAFVRMLRNHKYKVTAFTAATLYASDSIAFTIRRKLEREMHLREAKRIGDQPMAVKEQPRRLTIIMNPKSNKGKAKPTFNDDVAPMLHLAGVDYGIVETTHPGHAKELVESMDLSVTDGIVVCGGDGLIHEVVTGLLRRQDADQARRTPLGLIPLGSSNHTCRRIFGDDPLRTPSFYRSKAALALVKASATKDIDVAELTSAEATIYCLNSLRWGASSVWHSAVENTPWPISSLFPDVYASGMALLEKMAFPIKTSFSSVTGDFMSNDRDVADVFMSVGGDDTPGRLHIRVTHPTSRLDALRDGQRENITKDDDESEPARVSRFLANMGSIAFPHTPKSDDPEAPEAPETKILVDGEALPCRDAEIRILPGHIKIYA